MKKRPIHVVSILFAALSLVFTACNQGMSAGKEAGTVQIVLGGGTARAVNTAGLPILDETNTAIIVTNEDGAELANTKKTSLTLPVAVGTKITVKVVVTTAAGEWIGSKKHTVTSDMNTIAIKLSKKLKTAANLLFSTTTDAAGSSRASLSTANGTKLLDGMSISPKPCTARDSFGRIYLLYKEAATTPVANPTRLTRFDIEGNEDTAFNTKFAPALTAAGVTMNSIDTIAIDAKENYIFLLSGRSAYCFQEKDDASFESFGSDVLPISMAAEAAAVYGDTLYVVENLILHACEFEITTNPAGGAGKVLHVFTPVLQQNLAKLRSASAFGNNPTQCTGVFADEQYVYCLLSEHALSAATPSASPLYALGQLVRYKYTSESPSTPFIDEVKTPLPATVSGSSSIGYDGSSFSNPVGFIGYDEENLYIADDGKIIEQSGGTWNVTGNKNRIAAFNRKTYTLTFTDTNATWFDE